MDLVWREKFRVRFYDTEPSGYAAPAALCRYLMEAANSHCEPLGMTLAGLRATGRMWVLARFALQISRLPRRGEEVTVETWGSNRLGGVRAYRDFRLEDGSGATLAEASSLWLVLDTATRRPVRLPEEILQYRHPDRCTPLAVDATPLQAPDPVKTEERLRVRWRDLDGNGHANAVSHIEWALEAVPAEVRREARLASLDIQFAGEAFLGDEIISAAGESVTGNTRMYRHRVSSLDGRTLTLMLSSWAID